MLKDNSDSFVGQAMEKCCEESVKGVRSPMTHLKRKTQIPIGIWLNKFYET